MLADSTTTASIVLQPRFSLENTFGAVLVGTFVGLMYVLYLTKLETSWNQVITTALVRMHGLALHQAFTYFRTYTSDRLPLKLTVSFTAHLSYQYPVSPADCNLLVVLQDPRPCVSIG